jgi:hypothetical protein
MKLRAMTAFVAIMVLGIYPASAVIGATGHFGEKLSVTTSVLKGSQTVVVNGSNFDETVGIYLAYCVLPKKGAAPTPCGGGVNKKGIGDASYWISSNPPPYGIGLAIPFQPGGRFSQKLEISKRIGAIDCTRVTCAVTVRSDHLHEGDRTHDLFIPITFSNKK